MRAPAPRPLARANHSESGTLLVALACVLAAALLYLMAALIFGFDDESEGTELLRAAPEVRDGQ